MENSTQTIVIDSSPVMYRTAVLEDGRLKEIIIDKKTQASVVGNIYAAQVENVLPAQFAFIDIGGKRNAFLFLNDRKEGRRAKLKKNEHILVQAVKDPTGDKGAYVSTQLNLGGRYCVLVINNSDNDFTAVSKKITNADERERLRKIALRLSEENCSVIIRTSAEGIDEELIVTEAEELKSRYAEISRRFSAVRPPSLLYSEEHPLVGVIIDLYNKNTEAVYVNNPDDRNELADIAARHGLDSSKIFLYDGDSPIFQSFNIEKQIDKALEKKLWLKSGAFLYIEKTEAMTVFDVNSGKFAGSGGNERSMLKVNLEAAKEIAAQLRLRNLSGIVLVDFIDMKEEASKQALIDCLKRECAKDRISVNVLGMTKLGLVELTRKKAREPLSQLMTTECAVCRGGRVLAAFFAAAELLEEISRDNAKTGCADYQISTAPDVAAELREIQAAGHFSQLKLQIIENAASRERYKLTKKI